MKIKFKPRFFIILAVFLAAGVGVVMLFNQEREVLLKTVEKGRIMPITTRGTALKNLKDQYKNKFVVIFFYDGYTDQNQALNAIQVLKAATILVEPFKSFESDIVFKSFTTDSTKCHVKEENAKNLPAGRRGLLVCDAKLIGSFKSLGIDHFKLVILSPLDFSPTVLPARGSNSWMTLSTFQGNLSTADHKRFLGLTYMQSLGRSLGLGTEDDVSPTASDSAATLVLQRSPNCALDESQAKDWWGEATSVSAQIGYFKGCLGNSSYVYPEQDTLMSGHPKKESYGVVSTDYLRGVLACFYGNKAKPVFPAGQEATYSATLESCSMFKNAYPSFWTE